jgi:hypothetical protein
MRNKSSLLVFPSPFWTSREYHSRHVMSTFLYHEMGIFLLTPAKWPYSRILNLKQRKELRVEPEPFNVRTEREKK